MARLGTPGRQLRSFLFRSSVDDEVDAELTFHIEMLSRELMAAGMSREHAHDEAVRRFGDLADVQHTMRRIGRLRERDMRRTEYFGDLRQDVAYAVRQLARTPGFTLVAVFMLALGIGTTTAIFSVVESVVLRAFPFAHPERAVFVFERWGDRDGSVSVGNYVDLATASRSFDALAAVNYGSMNLAESGQPERVVGAFVTHDFFDVFGVRPRLGRTFAPGENEPGQEQVVILGYPLWRDRYGSDPRVIGRMMRLNERPYRIVGVMPEGFDPILSGEQLWTPVAFTAKQRAEHDEHYLTMVGLLKDGVTRARAQTELAGVMAELARRFPHDDADRGVRVAAVPEVLVGDYRQRLFVILGAVAFVLLIACGNVANLLLARGASRAKEVAIRAALGAGRSRLIRQLLAESAVLAVFAAVVGVAFAWAVVRLLVASAPPGIPRLDQTRVDWPVVMFALVAGLASSLLFGFVPAIRAARQDLQSTLREGGRGMGTARDRVRSVLIVTEVALALTLLVGAGLLLRSAYHLQQVKLGFDPAGVLAAHLALPADAYRSPEQVTRALEGLVDALGREPGVAAAAVSSHAPLGREGGSNGLVPEGKTLDLKNAIDSRLHMVTPGYFSVVHVSLVKGRLFTERDRAGTERVMVVSEALAKRAWPNQEAVGKRIACCEGQPDDPRWKTVIGVVGDVRSSGPATEIRPEFYLPIEQVPPEAWEWVQRSMTIVARATTGNAASLAAPMRRAVRQLDAGLPLYSVSSMDDALVRSMAEARFHTLLLAALGAIGLVLAALGIHSVIAFFVSIRTHEIGVRMALGATSGDVVTLLTWQGMRPVLAGVALGAVGALAASRLLAGSLYGVTTSDPVTYVGVATLLVGVGVLASLVPARRATQVDPMVAFRE